MTSSTDHLSYTIPNSVLIKQLRLVQHTEGGFFAETDRQEEQVSSPFADKALRPLAPSIYYLLTPDEPNGVFHMNKSATMHVLHQGRAEYTLITPGTPPKVERKVMGSNIHSGEVLQLLVPTGVWKMSRLLSEDREAAASKEDGKERYGWSRAWRTTAAGTASSTWRCSSGTARTGRSPRPLEQHLCALPLHVHPARTGQKGYPTGARWPKMTDPSGRSSPVDINELLNREQPHPLVFAEYEYRATLEKWREVVRVTADWMAVYAKRNKTTGFFDLGPPMYVVSEDTSRNATRNPAFELAYRRFELGHASTWMERLRRRGPRSEKT
ncbi:RmlC-like cupin domain-containing protein [Ganoderma leucocontextum]|nr:RmlC-like cupin domain-containing protein [Ganoderma leucocontextum]